ncbi:MAG: malonyl-ACP O-methyltransferase BioC [Gammaproteobacteria bacterium]|nr:malonyl-ACP O-methyltransferase BioC [Gammaproteobacteria bacterium]
MMNYKNKLIRTFSSAASDYDQEAELQRQVATDLVDLFFKTTVTDSFRDDFYPSLDLGSGTGFILKQLKKQIGFTLINLDISFGMLKHLQNQFTQASCICADADKLPFKEGQFKLIFSSLMLQWSTKLEETLDEINRILAQSGLFVFSTLGPHSLSQLRQSWFLIDQRPHVHDFIDKETLISFLEKKFQLILFLEKTYTLYYPDAMQAMLHLKKLGVTYRKLDQGTKLLGKQALKRVIEHYEQFRIEDKGVPLHYHVFFGIVKK